MTWNQAGDKTLPEPVITQLFAVLWRYEASMSKMISFAFLRKGTYLFNGFTPLLYAFFFLLFPSQYMNDPTIAGVI